MKSFNSLGLTRRTRRSPRRRLLLSLKKLVKHCSVLKTFHLTLVLARRLNLHTLRQSLTFARQRTLTQTLLQSKIALQKQVLRAQTLLLQRRKN
jgi:hypothetical protein